MTIIECKKCREKFGYEERDDVWPGGKEKENVNCPHCGETALSIMTSGYIQVFKIEEED